MTTPVQGPPSGRSHHQARPMIFRQNENGCMIAVTHKTDQDGYLCKTWSVNGSRVKEPFHRFIYRAHHRMTECPDRHEVDHICGNRACCNPKHLRMLERSDHKRVTNAERYSARNEAAQCYWLARIDSGLKCTGAHLSATFGVGPSTGRRWVSEWKAEDAEGDE